MTSLSWACSSASGPGWTVWPSSTRARRCSPGTCSWSKVIASAPAAALRRASRSRVLAQHDVRRDQRRGLVGARREHPQRLPEGHRRLVRHPRQLTGADHRHHGQAGALVHGRETVRADQNSAGPGSSGLGPSGPSSRSRSEQRAGAVVGGGQARDPHRGRPDQPLGGGEPASPAGGAARPPARRGPRAGRGRRRCRARRRRSTRRRRTPPRPPPRRSSAARRGASRGRRARGRPARGPRRAARPWARAAR